MKIYFKSTVSDTKQRGVLEEYLRKYCPEYLESKNKEYMLNQTAKEFEAGKNPFRKYSSDFNDSMTQVWESYRRKFMSL